MVRKALLAVVVLAVLLLAATAALRLWLHSDALRTAIERQATTALGTPVRITGAQARVFPRLGLQLRGIQVGSPAVAQVEEITVATGFALLTSRRIEQADIQLTGGFIDAAVLAALGGAAAQPAGTDASERASGRLVIASIRSIRLSDVEVRVGAHRLRTNLEAAIAGDRVALTGLTAELAGATLRLHGELTSAARLEGAFELQADVLPTDALVALLAAGSSKTGLGTPAQSVPSAPYNVTVAVKAREAILGATAVQALDARVTVTPARVAVAPLTFTVHGGKVEGKALVRTSGTAPHLELSVTASGLDVTRLEQASPGTMTGQLDANVSLQGPVRDSFSSWLDIAMGAVDLHVRDGRMPGIEVIRRSVIRFAGRSGQGENTPASDAYNRLDASLTLQDGSARIESVALEAADFGVRGAGTLRLRDSAIALQASLTLSEALSQQAGRDLYRYAREDRRVVLPARIGGTLSAPSATIDIGEAARRALRNRIEEEAGSLIDRLIRRR